LWKEDSWSRRIRGKVSQNTGCATVAAAFFVLLAPPGQVGAMLALMIVAEGILKSFSEQLALIQVCQTSWWPSCIGETLSGDFARSSMFSARWDSGVAPCWRTTCRIKWCGKLPESSCSPSYFMFAGENSLTFPEKTEKSPIQ